MGIPQANYKEELTTFLRSHHLPFGEINDWRGTLFPVLWMEANRLAIHLIPINEQLAHLPADYFAKLSNDAMVKNIRMIHLWEDRWKGAKEIAQGRLLALAGISGKIHARQTEVIRLSSGEAKPFLQRNHLQGSTSAYYKYGLMKGDSLMAVASFGKSRVMYDGPVYYRSFELERYTACLGMTVTGGLGKLTGHFIKKHQPAHLMTYADRDWGEGNSYKKLGFRFEGHTGPASFYVHPHKHTRLYAVKQDPVQMQKEGFIRIFNSGNAKWILDRRSRP